MLVLPGFVRPGAVETVRREGDACRHLAYYTVDRHNAYLAPPDPGLPRDHPRNREVVSSKGCITDDQIARTSPLRALYDAEAFRGFLCAVLGERALHPYADPLSSINLHYANPGQELGWHFDNSSFAITLMIQAPESGGAFEYVGGLRDADEIAKLDIPSFCANPSAPTNLTKHQAVDLNVPIGCGGVAVFPGDVAVGDGDGVIIIPAELADEIAAEAKGMEEYEAWVVDQVKAGASRVFVRMR